MRTTCRQPLPAVLLMLCFNASVFAQEAAHSTPDAKVLTLNVSPQAEPAETTFTTVQAAVDAAIKTEDGSRVIISIAPGTYRERVKIPKKAPPITFLGDTDDPARVTIVFDLRAGMNDPVTGKKVGTSGCETVLVESNDFTAERITFANDAGDRGQAVAIRTRGDRAIFRNCRFTGWQDTLYANGDRHYFVDCYVEGRVDFIFGRATAVFERCTIVSKSGGYITAASTPVERKHGFVFLDCKLTSPDGVPTYLGRPWKPDAAVAFVRCEMGPHIVPEGWHDWGKAENEKTARYAEFQSTGSGAATDRRVPWSRQLTSAEADDLTPQRVLAGADSWDPTRP